MGKISFVSYPYRVTRKIQYTVFGSSKSEVRLHCIVYKIIYLWFPVSQQWTMGTVKRLVMFGIKGWGLTYFLLYLCMVFLIQTRFGAT